MKKSIINLILSSTITLLILTSCMGEYIQLEDKQNPNITLTQNLTDGDLKFLVVTDIHTNIIHDSDRRIEEIATRLETTEVDFVIQLGDFVEIQDDKNAEIVSSVNNLHPNVFHVLGNHDMDQGTKLATMKHWGMAANYYYFDVKGYRMIVLDCNYFLDEAGNPIHYKNGNYYANAPTRGTLPAEQQAWLKETVATAPNKVIIFSHQSIENEGSMANGAQVHELLVDLNEANGNKIVAAFNGHDHIDKAVTEDGIHYLQLNSNCYQWVGDNFASTDRFPAFAYEMRPNLKYCVGYEESLYAVVTVTDAEIIYDGIEGDFIGDVTPEFINAFNNANPTLPLSSSITSGKFPIIKD